LPQLNRLWPAHNAGLAELLITLRRQFGGDLDAMLILLILGVGTEAENWPGVLLDRSDQATKMHPTSVQSIAEISGIPRESVRRKMRALAEKGWIRRNERGLWQPGEQATLDLRPSTQATISYFLRIFQAARPHDE
jgi:hypothetical protein